MLRWKDFDIPVVHIPDTAKITEMYVNFDLLNTYCCFSFTNLLLTVK